MGAHLIDGEFQSDKYPSCPRGKVPLSVKDPMAQDLLWEYAQRRRAVDAEFADDLEAALRAAGFEPMSPFAKAVGAVLDLQAFHQQQEAAPGFWMNEASGVLRPVVERYIAGGELDAQQLATMRAYLRQWIAAPGFRGPDVEYLRRQVEAINDMAALRAWLEAAVGAGVDPL